MKGNHMLKQNELPIGCTVRVVPVGKLADIKYNGNGIISGIYDTDGKTTGDKWDSDLCVRIQKNGIIPSRLVNAKSCTVRGVFHHNTAKIEYLEKHGVDSDVESALQSIEIENVEFQAFDLIDSNVSYGAYQAATTLNMMGFEGCKSFVWNGDSSHTLKIDTLQAMSDYPFVSGYAIVMNGKNSSYVDSNIRVERVQSIERIVNRTGYIDALIQTVRGNSYVVPYARIVRYNVMPNSLIVWDEDIKFCSDRNSKAKKVSQDIRCDFCGAQIHVPVTKNGYVKCGYDNCTSSMYPTIENMLSMFGVDCIEYPVYLDYVKSKKIRSLCDVMSLPEYKDTKIKLKISKLLSALCPPGIVRSADFFDKMLECAKSFDAMLYYLDNPQDIKKDMLRVLNPIDIKSFETWISDPENLLTVKTFISMDNIVLVKDSVDIDVPKLFRNKRILLEGRFRHGSYSTVSSILKSYGADIVVEFDNRCDCVIIGGLEKNPYAFDSVAKAGSYHIPVFEEIGFFRDYGIDSDIANIPKTLDSADSEVM